MTDKPLQPHEQRVITEAQELKAKLEKFEFHTSQFAHNLHASGEEVDLRYKQIKAMKKHLSILHQRIGRFTTNQSND